MIDPELKEHLVKIENELSQMEKKSVGFWNTVWRGCIYGAGYIIGAVIVIVIAGWVLNIVGIIPLFGNQVTNFRAALDRVSGPVK